MRTLVQRYVECNKTTKLGREGPSCLDLFYIGKSWEHPATSKQLQDAGGKFLGSGVHRVALAFGPKKNCVVKVAKTEDSRHANLNEIGVYRSIRKKVKGTFGPIEDADSRKGWWLTQPRAKIGSELSSAERREVEEKIGDDIRSYLERKLSESKLHCPDLHANNFGIWDGRPIIIDYGFGLQCMRRGKVIGGKKFQFGTPSMGEGYERVPPTPLPPRPRRPRGQMSLRRFA